MVGRGGWRQKNPPPEDFSTTGESLLACQLAATTRNKRYKLSDRSGVVERLGETYAARPNPQGENSPRADIKKARNKRTL